MVGFPEGPNQEWLESLIQQACGSDPVRIAPHADEILIYREYSRLPLTDLQQLGPIAEDAYQSALGNSTCPPHIRTDIPEWSDVEVS